METKQFARGAALIILPMLAASCGGSNAPAPTAPPNFYPDMIKSGPPSVSGCTVTEESCNSESLVGVFAKINYNPETEEIEIRFVSVNDNGDETFTYNDGENAFVVDALGDGPNGEFLSAVLTGAYYSVNMFGVVSPDDFVDGIVGAPTDASVIPLGEDVLASYSGNSYIAFGDYNTESFEYGTSSLEVDFLTGLADLTIDLDEFDNAITEFDQIVSNNMQIDGYTFTGDEALLLLLGEPVNVTGTNTDSASAGIFYGPVNADGNPEEFGAVAVVGGDDGYVYGLAEGQVAPLP